jgi:hypothetical protein
MEISILLNVIFISLVSIGFIYFQIWIGSKVIKLIKDLDLSVSMLHQTEGLLHQRIEEVEKLLEQRINDSESRSDINDTDLHKRIDKLDSKLDKEVKQILSDFSMPKIG